MKPMLHRAGGGSGAKLACVVSSFIFMLLMSPGSFSLLFRESSFTPLLALRESIYVHQGSTTTPANGAQRDYFRVMGHVLNLSAYNETRNYMQLQLSLACRAILVRLRPSNYNDVQCMENRSAR